MAAQPSLSTVPVSEAMCQSRTKEIMDSQSALLRTVNEIRVMMADHIGRHKGQESVRNRDVSRAGLAVRYIGLGVTIICAVGSAVWIVARGLS